MRGSRAIGLLCLVSGLPVAVGLWLAPRDVLVGYFLVAIVLDHAHLVCPVGLAWGSRALRQRNLERPGKYLLLPGLCLFVAVAIGYAAPSTRDPLFRDLTLVYFWWNFWHFAAQHFGVASICRLGSRTPRRVAAVGGTAAVLLGLPFLLPGTLWVVCLTEGVSFAHWITDIGLTGARVRRWWAFLAVVLLVGLTGFIWKGVSVGGGLQAAHTVAVGVPLLLGLRYGLGFVHFLYSRWVWQLRDPLVHAAIK